MNTVNKKINEGESPMSNHAKKNAQAKQAATRVVLPVATTKCHECWALPGQRHDLSCTEVTREMFYEALNEMYPTEATNTEHGTY